MTDFHHATRLASVGMWTRHNHRHVELREEQVARAGRGAARARREDAGPRAPLRERRAARRRRGPPGCELATFGMGCFWGAERKFWEHDGVFSTAVGYAGGDDAQPDLPRGLLGADRPHRGRAGGLRSEGRELRPAVEAVLGEPRPDAGDAPGERQRDAIPLGDLHARPRAAARRRGVARRLRARADGRGVRRDHDGDRAPRRRSITPRTTTSSTWPRTPTATAESAAPASPAPSAWRPARLLNRQSEIGRRRRRGRGSSRRAGAGRGGARRAARAAWRRSTR